MGEQFRLHHDGHNRFATAYLFLNDDFEGGWTYFPLGPNATRPQQQTAPTPHERTLCEGGLRVVPRTGDVTERQRVARSPLASSGPYSVELKNRCARNSGALKHPGLLGHF